MHFIQLKQLQTAMLSSVLLTPEVWSACWTHVLTSQCEEVMGVLIGRDSSTEENTVVVTATKIFRRITKQKDRVEIGNDDMVDAMDYAEKLGGERRVVGWYHSHPNITVPPSHVDLGTQANYQTMDKNFVGLIFSVFNYDERTGTDTKEAIAFQTSSTGQCRYVRLEVGRGQALDRDEESAVKAVTSIPAVLKHEELEECGKMTGGWPDPLSLVQNKAVLISQLAKQTDLITVPILNSLAERENFLKDRLERLRQEEDTLRIQLREVQGMVEDGK